MRARLPLRHSRARSVITSYSIHYTKLYDKIILRWAKTRIPQGLQQIRSTRQKNSADGLTLPYRGTAKKKLGDLLRPAKAGHEHGPHEVCCMQYTGEEALGLIETLGRITSYNVCYTKLLRNRYQEAYDILTK